MSKILKQIIIIFVILIVLFLILNYKIGFFQNENVTQASPTGRDNTALPVSAEVIKPRPLSNKIKVTGTVLANESIELKSEISGKISNIFFREGDRIPKGKLLVSINDEELQAQFEKLKYNKKLYKDNEFRQKKLLEKEAISQEEYEIALTELNSIEADIKLVQAQIDKAHLRAPFSGIIGLRQVSEGSYISPSTTIANFFSIDPIKLEFSVPGKYSSQIQTGQKMIFTVESLDDVFTGTVYAIEPQIDPDTRTLQVRAISENKNRNLLPGQFANIEITLETIDNALLVPTMAIIPELNGHKLYKYENGAAKAVQVQIGTRTDQHVQISKGINPEDTILTSGILQVRDGVPVQITELN